MTGRVFISCGQRTDERKFAKKLASWFRSKGFIPYVAIDTQSIQDVNSGIINELRNSDFYVFIDFKREEIGKDHKGNSVHRGSLFTNQELAIAYYLNFERIIFFQQVGVKLEGLLQYILSNATKFHDANDLLEKVKEAVKKRNWKPSYTRHLIPKSLKWSKEVPLHRDHVENICLNCKVLQIYIENKRDDIASFNTVARLDYYTKGNGRKKYDPDRTLLKATDQPGFNQVIWPNNYCAFDLLLIQRKIPPNIYLLSALDSHPRDPIIRKEGTYNLHYSVVAEGFPVLNFVVKIIHKGGFSTIKASLK